MHNNHEETQRRHPTAKEVFTDGIMRKGHVHLKENKAKRAKNRTALRMLDLDSAKDFMEDLDDSE